MTWIKFKGFKEFHILHLLSIFSAFMLTPQSLQLDTNSWGSSLWFLFLFKEMQQFLWLNPGTNKMISKSYRQLKARQQLMSFKVRPQILNKVDISFRYTELAQTQITIFCCLKLLSIQKERPSLCQLSDLKFHWDGKKESCLASKSCSITHMIVAIYCILLTFLIQKTAAIVFHKSFLK